LTMARPSPVPPSFRVRAWSVRTKRSSTLSRSFSGMPALRWATSGTP
jgi:hypothetical protein